LSQPVDKHPLRSLAKSLLFGTLLFLSLIVAVQLVLTLLARGVGIDATFWRFYPLMGGVGALFGFERWWAYEQDGVNPFHR